MLRRLIVVTAVAAGLSVAAISLATPALAKGPSRVSITGPGLARAIVLSGGGEPGQLNTLAVLAGQTGLYSALFGAGVGVPAQPTPMRNPPPTLTLGPRYTVIYTVPGVPGPDDLYGQIRQDLYPSAAGGPVIYTSPNQRGFGQLQVTGWLRASPQLRNTLAKLGVPLRPETPAAPRTRPPTAHPAPAHQPGSRTLAWLVAAALAIAAAALAGLALWLRHRKPGIVPDSDPAPAAPPPGQPSGLR